MKKSNPAGAWSSENAVNYYVSHRYSVDDLYKSEKYFLENAVRAGKNLLDVGCAVGGFSKIVKKYNKDIEYTGIDISPRMIDKAKKLYPNDNFRLCNGETLDFPDNSFDAVISFGVLHMIENWRSLLMEAWRVCRGSLIFDLRIVNGTGVCNAGESYQRLYFDGKWDGVSKAPYVVVGLDEITDRLIEMRPEIRSLRTYGYWHPVSEMTVSRFDLVCMSVFCLNKTGDKKNIDWKLPMDLPERLAKETIDS